MSAEHSPFPSDGNWESDGGSPLALEARSLGVTRLLTETFAVAGYRYTSLTDAVAQARRLRSRPAAS